MPRLTTTLLTTLLLRPLTLAGATLLPGQRRIVRRRQRTVPRITLQQTIVLINPLPQRGDLRQQAEHQLNRRLTTRPRDTLRIRNTHERKIPCALKESSRSPRPHVNAYVEEAGARLVQQLVARGRKASTTIGYQSYLRVHVAPFFGEKQIADITKEDIEEFVAVCLDNDQSIKSTRNYLGLLHSVFDFALRKGWVVANLCMAVEKPEGVDEDQDIRFLDQAELDALLAATTRPSSRRKAGTAERAERVRRLRDGEKLPWKRIGAELGIAESTAIYLYGLDLDETGAADPLSEVERVLYLTAAMTGMRQGELLALRWIDVDWTAQRVRVRRNFVRGKFGTPKSKRSSRSIPLADDVARELELLFQSSSYQADDDLVFAHPHNGRPIDRSLLLKRFKAALRRAGVREIRFHDLRHLADARVMRPA